MTRPGGLLFGIGNSYMEGFLLTGFPNSADRYLTRLARRLGMTEINWSISGSELAAPTSPAYRGILHRALSCYRPGSDANTLSPLDICFVQVGQNEAGDTYYYSDTTLFPKHLRRTIQRLRESMFYEVETGGYFVLSTGTGGTAWSTPSLFNNEGTTSGPGARTTSAVGNYFTLTLPANFPGGEVILHGFAFYNQGVNFDLTLDGTSVGQWDSRTATTASSFPTGVPVYKSLGVLAPGTHTIVGTVNAVGAGGGFHLDGAGVTAANPPLIVLPDYIPAPVLPVGPNTHSPITETDRQTFSGYLQAMAAEFTDGQVLFAPCTIPVTAANFAADGSHPSSLGHALIEALLWQAISVHPHMRRQRTLRQPALSNRVQFRNSVYDGSFATVTLAGGTGTFTSRALTGQSHLILQRKTAGSAPGFLTYAFTAVSGSGAVTCTITSSNSSDNGIVEVLIYEALS